MFPKERKRHTEEILPAARSISVFQLLVKERKIFANHLVTSAVCMLVRRTGTDTW